MERSHHEQVEGKSFEEIVVWMTERKQMLQAKLEEGEISPDELEREWQQVIQCVERGGIADFIEASDPDTDTLWIGDDEYRRVDKKAKTYHAASGKTRAQRSLYRKRGERNGPLVCPVELIWGMVGGKWTPLCARQMAYLGQELPYGQAAKLADEMGRAAYSRASFERITDKLGARWEAERDRLEDALMDTFEVPDEAVSVSVAIDRVSLPLDEALAGWWQDARKVDGDIHYRMAYCATVTLHDANGEPLECIRYGRLPYEGSWVIREQLVWDLKAILNQREDLQVICLSDGASELCDLLDEAIVEADFTGEVTRLIDLWHLLEKLGAALSAYKDDEKEAKLCLQAYRMWLLNDDGAPEMLTTILRSWQAQDLSIGGERPVHQALTYLDNHKDQMRYASARKRGLPVGSGQVEATCKALVEARMKRNGQYWKSEGAQSALNLRALALSDRWDEAMKKLLAEYQTDDEIYARKRVA